MKRRKIRHRIKQILEKRYPGITFGNCMRAVSSDNRLNVNLSSSERQFLRGAGVIAKPTTVISTWSLLDILSGMDPRIIRIRREPVPVLTEKKKSLMGRFLDWIKSVLGFARKCGGKDD